MPGLDQDWYARNASRAYPLDDASTGRTDDGRPLPPGLLVDAMLRVAAAAAAPRLAGLTSGPGLVTAVFASEDGLIGAATALQPAAGRAVEVVGPDGLVVGWVAFGAATAAASPWSGRFATPAQAALLDRCLVRTPPTLPGLQGPAGRDGPTLAGHVVLEGGGDLEVVDREIPVVLESSPTTVPALGLRLRRSTPDGRGAAPRARYAGPCAARPIAGGCLRTPIERVNGVAPDCDGILTLELRDFIVIPIVDAASSTPDAVLDVALDLPWSLADACAAGRDAAEDPVPDAAGRVRPAPERPPACAEPVLLRIDLMTVVS